MTLFDLMVLCASSLAHVQPPPSTATLYDVEDAENIFEDFINKYNKEYNNEQEKQDRFNIFKELLAIVNQLRVKQPQALFENGTPYRLIENSWGQDRDEHGYRNVKPGDNLSGIDYSPGVIAKVA